MTNNQDREPTRGSPAWLAAESFRHTEIATSNDETINPLIHAQLAVAYALLAHTARAP